MFLRSGPDWHFDVERRLTFEAFAGDRIPDPIPIAMYLAYADWFVEQAGIEVRDETVTAVSASGARFTAALGERRRDLRARRRRGARHRALRPRARLGRRARRAHVRRRRLHGLPRRPRADRRRAPERVRVGGAARRGGRRADRRRPPPRRRRASTRSAGRSPTSTSTPRSRPTAGGAACRPPTATRSAAASGRSAASRSRTGSSPGWKPRRCTCTRTPRSSPSTARPSPRRRAATPR